MPPKKTKDTITSYEAYRFFSNMDATFPVYAIGAGGVKVPVKLVLNKRIIEIRKAD